MLRKKEPPQAAHTGDPTALMSAAGGLPPNLLLKSFYMRMESTTLQIFEDRFNRKIMFGMHAHLSRICDVTQQALQTPAVRQHLQILWKDHSSLRALPTLQRGKNCFSVLFRKRNFTKREFVSHSVCCRALGDQIPTVPGWLLITHPRVTPGGLFCLLSHGKQGC